MILATRDGKGGYKGRPYQSNTLFRNIRANWREGHFYLGRGGFPHSLPSRKKRSGVQYPHRSGAYTLRVQAIRVNPPVRVNAIETKDGKGIHKGHPYRSKYFSETIGQPVPKIFFIWVGAGS